MTWCKLTGCRASNKLRTTGCSRVWHRPEETKVVLINTTVHDNLHPGGAGTQSRWDVHHVQLQPDRRKLERQTFIDDLVHIFRGTKNIHEIDLVRYSFQRGVSFLAQYRI